MLQQRKSRLKISATTTTRVQNALLVGWLFLLPAFLLRATLAQSQTLPSFLKEEDDGDPIQFLFLGNSFTNYNNLPKMVQTLLEEGVPELQGKLSMKKRDPGGERFTGHLKQLASTTTESSPTQLRKWLVGDETTPSVPWNVVVLQEQSQIPGFHILEGQGGDGGKEFANSILALEQLHNQYISQANTKHKNSKGKTVPPPQTLLLLTWAKRNGDATNEKLFPNFGTMQRLLRQGYQRYRSAIHADEHPVWMAPAGMVFETIHNDFLLQHNNDPATDPNSLFYQLYARDGSHPSLAGSYVAALTIYVTLTGHDPKQIEWCPPNLDKDVCGSIQDAVHRTILQTHEAKTIQYPWATPFKTSNAVDTDEL